MRLPHPRSSFALPRLALHIPLPTRALLLSAFVIVLALPCARVLAQTEADKEQCLAAHERAQADRMEGRLLDARAGLLICAQRTCPRLVSKDCSVWLSEVDASLPTVVLAAVDAQGGELREVRVSAGERVLTNHLDGQPLMLDPGTYALRFEAAGFAPVTEQVTIQEGERGRVLRVTLQAPAGEALAESAGEGAAEAGGAPRAASQGERARRFLIASSVLLGTSVALGAVALGTGLSGHKKERRCRDEGCSEELRERGARLYRTVDYAGALGGALLITGGALLWSGLRKRSAREPRDAKNTATSLKPYFTGNGAGVSLRGAF